MKATAILGLDQRASADDAVARLHAEHASAVYKHLRLIGLDARSAEDILQETFLRLLAELRHGRTPQTPRWWLLKVASNLGLNWLRDTAGRREIESEPATAILERAIAEGADAEQRVLDAERARRLAAALDQLSPQQKACIHLRAEGLRYREIAEALGVSISTVEEFLGRAIARLRMNLK